MTAQNLHCMLWSDEVSGKRVSEQANKWTYIHARTMCNENMCMCMCNWLLLLPPPPPPLLLLCLSLILQCSRNCCCCFWLFLLIFQPYHVSFSTLPWAVQRLLSVCLCACTYVHEQVLVFSFWSVYDFNICEVDGPLPLCRLIECTWVHINFCLVEFYDCSFGE